MKREQRVTIRGWRREKSTERRRGGGWQCRVREGNYWKRNWRFCCAETLPEKSSRFA